MEGVTEGGRKEREGVREGVIEREGVIRDGVIEREGVRDGVIREGVRDGVTQFEGAKVVDFPEGATRGKEGGGP